MTFSAGRLAMPLIANHRFPFRGWARRRLRRGYNGSMSTPEDQSVTSSSAARRWTVIASGLLVLALALVVIYTRPGAFLSPIALVVVSAIGLAALLLQLRFRRDLPQVRSPLWLNILGVLF